ncbi:hypothetical protein [Qipengyuania flava]|uniref:hypothetical protein n=1 Tax=Qipengyuania flava TaxID=192812 RepID=UPI003BAEA02D
MEVEVNGVIPVTGDCGHKFEIPIARADEEFECPICGARDRLSDEQVASVVAQVRAAAGEFGAEKLGEAVRKGIKRATRGSKSLKYTKK